jgi:hypothetical protein
MLENEVKTPLADAQDSEDRKKNNKPQCGSHRGERNNGEITMDRSFFFECACKSGDGGHSGYLI